MVNDHPVLYTLHVPSDTLAVCALCVTSSFPKCIEATADLVEQVNIDQQGRSPEDSFIFKSKTFFYKSFGETLAKDVEKYWGEQKGMATDWRNM